MTETITLPKSGIVLEPLNPIFFKVTLGRQSFLAYDDGTRWTAEEATPGVCHDMKQGTRDDCIAWLDARVLELRAALLPADARERVARAISDEADLIVMEESRPQRMLRIADAGLAALVRP